MLFKQTKLMTMKILTRILKIISPSHPSVNSQ